MTTPLESHVEWLSEACLGQPITLGVIRSFGGARDYHLLHA